MNGQIKNDRSKTTILGVEFDGGVVIGAYNSDSSNKIGVYVANRFTEKVINITDKIYCYCRCPSDTFQEILNYKARCRRNETCEVLGEDIKPASDFNSFKLKLGIIFPDGWDKNNERPVYSTPLGALYFHQGICIGGHGGIYIIEFLRKYYRPGMTRNECFEFVEKAIKLAMSVPGRYSSGFRFSVGRIGVITNSDIERSV